MSASLNRVQPLQGLPAAKQAGWMALTCPRCRAYIGPLDSALPPMFDPWFVCPLCSFEMRHQRGIWLALPPERLRHYERFIADYQVVRASENRGSREAAFYLALPYRDLTGANQAQWTIRGRTFHCIESTILPELEARKPQLGILDLGAGNGWLSYRLALRSHLPVAVDLLTNNLDGLGASSHYLERLTTVFPRFQAELECLPFADDQFDCAIFNASFHYSEDYTRTLGEAIRCLRPGGTVVIADTPWYARDESGQQMVAERRALFLGRYGFASDGLASLEYLTDARLESMEEKFGLKWRMHRPGYGLRWASRPWIARLKGRREPSEFRVYSAEVTKR